MTTRETCGRKQALNVTTKEGGPCAPQCPLAARTRQCVPSLGRGFSSSRDMESMESCRRSKFAREEMGRRQRLGLHLSRAGRTRSSPRSSSERAITQKD